MSNTITAVVMATSPDGTCSSLGECWFMFGLYMFLCLVAAGGGLMSLIMRR